MAQTFDFSNGGYQGGGATSGLANPSDYTGSASGSGTGSAISFSGSDIVNFATQGLNSVTNLFGTVWNATHGEPVQTNNNQGYGSNQPANQQQPTQNPTGLSTTTMVMALILFFLVLAVLVMVVKSMTSKS